MIDILNFVNFKAELGNDKNLVVWLSSRKRMFSVSVAKEQSIVSWNGVQFVCLLLLVSMMQKTDTNWTSFQN